MKSSGSDFGISYGFVIIAAILIFLMTVSDPKIVKMFLDTFLEIF